MKKWYLIVSFIVLCFGAMAQNNVIIGEYFFDTDPGVGNGIPITMDVNDTVQATFEADLTGLSVGYHRAYVRSKDANGAWSLWARPLNRFYVYDDSPVVPEEIITSTLVAAEYFVDNDPGVGNGIPIPIAQGDTTVGSIDIDVSPYDVGTHWAYIRAKNSKDEWGLWARKQFTVCADMLESPQVNGATSFCFGSVISMNGGAVTDADSYYWKGPDDFTQNGLVLFRNNATAEMAGEYTLFAVRNGGTGCDTSSVSVQISVLSNFESETSQTICFGESFSLNGTDYSTSGTFTEVFQTENGCDSIVTLQLTVLPEISVNNPIQICEGGSYSIGDNTYTEAGTYTDVLSSIAGCDSTVTTIITISEVIEITNSVSLCYGESITVGDNTYSSSGTYTDNFSLADGCDSIVTTIVTVLPEIINDNPQTICFGDSYSIGDNTYDTSGTYTDVLTSSEGCDSTIITVLTVLPEITANNPQTICFGDGYSIGDNTYYTSGTYTDVLISSAGCDSTVTTVLNVLDFMESIDFVTICPGESVTVGDNTYSDEGTYTDIFQSVEGCDSIITTVLSIAPDLSTDVFVNNSELTADEENATYQWVDCGNNNAFIDGATEQSFTATQSGIYAVILTSIDCPDISVISDCYTVTVTGLTDFDWSALKIYPNPTDDKVFIESSVMIESIKLRDINGKLISTQEVNSISTSLNLGKLSKGIYLIEIWDGNGNMNVSKVVKE